MQILKWMKTVWDLGILQQVFVCLCIPRGPEQLAVICSFVVFCCVVLCCVETFRAVLCCVDLCCVIFFSVLLYCVVL